MISDLRPPSSAYTSGIETCKSLDTATCSHLQDAQCGSSNELRVNKSHIAPDQRRQVMKQGGISTCSGSVLEHGTSLSRGIGGFNAAMLPVPLSLLSCHYVWRKRVDNDHSLKKLMHVSDSVFTTSLLLLTYHTTTRGAINHRMHLLFVKLSRHR